MAVGNTTNALQRFLDAQNQTYLKALSEIRSGRKLTHWMWFVFPQMRGLGHSDTALFYGIRNLEEATAFFVASSSWKAYDRDFAGGFEYQRKICK